MKLSKKSLTVLSFTVGACLFVSTAFADSLLGSGYDRLKDSFKNTAAQMEKDLNNYTLETLYTLKDNDRTLIESSSTQKMDTVSKVSENSEVTKNAKGETHSNYSYSDANQSISKNEWDNTYYVMEYPKDVNRRSQSEFRNPFKEKGASEVEKIVDAVVGSLKDYVQVEEGTDGGKVYSGSLSEAQVPAVVNAITSFGIQRELSHEGDLDIPVIESDIYVKKVVGKAVENKAGYLESLSGDITLSGKDKNGVQHDFKLNVLAKMTDVGSTKVTKPDLTNAKIEKISNQPNGFSSKYVGTYKNDIIMDKDGKFVKIGERTLEILSVEGDKITGKYSEVVKPGFEKDYPNPDTFSFEYSPSATQTFSYTDAQGEQKSGTIYANPTGKIYFQTGLEVVEKNGVVNRKSTMKANFDGEFSRVFE